MSRPADFCCCWLVEAGLGLAVQGVPLGKLVPRDVCSPITGLPPLFPWVLQTEKPELKKMHKGIHGKETLSSLPLPSSWRSQMTKISPSQGVKTETFPLVESVVASGVVARGVWDSQSPACRVID